MPRLHVIATLPFILIEIVSPVIFPFHVPKTLLTKYFHVLKLTRAGIGWSCFKCGTGTTIGARERYIYPVLNHIDHKNLMILSIKDYRINLLGLRRLGLLLLSLIEQVVLSYLGLHSLCNL